MSHGHAESLLRQAARALTRRPPLGPERLVSLVLIGIAAAWVTRAGALPGHTFHVLGPAAQGILWACLYAGVGAAYLTLAHEKATSARSVRRRVALSLLLALLSTYLCKLLLSPHLAPQGWPEFQYLRLVLPPALIGLWCTALLPRQTRALYRAAKTSARLSPLLELTVLLLTAAVLVSYGDLAFQWRSGSGAEDRLQRDVISLQAWTSNVLIVFSAYALVFAITSRAAAGLLLVTPVFVALNIATFAKIKYMHSAVQPLDLIRIPEFLPLFHSFFGRQAVLTSLATAIIWIAAVVMVRKLEPSRPSAVRRWSLAGAAFVTLLTCPVAFLLRPSLPAAATLVRLAGAADVQHREMARGSGVLLSFISEIPAAFVTAPANYSPALVTRTLSKYDDGRIAPESSRAGRVNLIFYMVESFMDPNDLGLHYTSDPIPNVRALSRAHVSGYGIVPERFGGSANTEFEALTGMTMSFLPQGTLPYRQYLRRPIPSLPRALRNAGYATVAVQADARYYYDRERVYDLLGFEHVVWVTDLPGVERAARPGGWPSDRAVVEAVIRMSRGPRPFFVFAFPSSTHSPYHHRTYAGSELDVLDRPVLDTVGEVKEYINALRVADRDIGSLVEYFRRQPDSTIIAIVGDHLAPLSEASLGPFFVSLQGKPDPEQARITHRVPLLVWANFDLPPEPIELSISALPSYLLEKLGVAPTGFLRVTDAARRMVPVLGRYIRGPRGEIWDRDSLPNEERAVLDDYRLLQYDLLIGNQYSLRDSSAQCCGANR